MLLFVLVEMLLITEFLANIDKIWRNKKKVLRIIVTNKMVSIEVNEGFQGCSIFDF